MPRARFTLRWMTIVVTVALVGCFAPGGRLNRRAAVSADLAGATRGDASPLRGRSRPGLRRRLANQGGEGKQPEDGLARAEQFTGSRSRLEAKILTGCAKFSNST